MYIADGEVLAAGAIGELLAKYEVACFAEMPKEQVVGLKEVKNGYEGLIAAGAPSDCAARRPADLDALMIHLETARKRRKNVRTLKKRIFARPAPCVRAVRVFCGDGVYSQLSL